MKIVIIHGSPRKAGNSALLAEAFADGARSNNHEAEIISVSDYQVAPCGACDYCKRESGKCCQNDDMQLIYNKLATADVLIIASPVYFYSLSAQIKAVIDRLHNPIRKTFHIRKVGLLLVAGASLPTEFDVIKLQHKLLLDFFKLEDAGSVTVLGVNAEGDIRRTDALERARALGQKM